MSNPDFIETKGSLERIEKVSNRNLENQNRHCCKPKIRQIANCFKL